MTNVKQLLIALYAGISLCAFAATPNRIVGTGTGGNSIYATDAYPGFDGLDDLPQPEKKERSWFLWTSCDTASEQLAYAQEALEAGSIRKARRACDALVREWPAAPEAAAAQAMLAEIWATKEGDLQEAFDALIYELDFYPRAVAYEETITRAYKYANELVDTRTTFWGLSFRSLRVLRQNYEIAVRHAPGAEWVPDALMRIAHLREMDDHYEEAVEVYGGLLNRFPNTKQAHEALYLSAVARMWVTRRLAYNRARCLDTINYLKLALKQSPDHEKADEMKTWVSEITDYLAKEAYAQAKFYDSRQRTAHAAVTAWENFLKEYPETSHAEEIRARIEQLKGKSQVKGDAQ